MPNQITDYGQMNGEMKAAALLITLGSEVSANILRYVREEDIERVTLRILMMDKVAPDIREMVFDEAHELSLARHYITSGGAQYAREMLTHSLGEDRADEIVARLVASIRVAPFDFLKNSDPAQLVTFIRNEHPQTIALILSYLPPTQSASILASLDEEMQADVSSRVANMDSTSPDVIKRVEHLLRERLSSVLSTDNTTVGGLEFLVKMLSQVDRATERSILDRLNETEPELAEQIKKQMFVFENIIQLDGRAVQRLMRDVDMKDLTLALKGASEEVRQLILANMSTRAAAGLREEMEVMGPVRLKNVEEAQQRIVNIVRRLEESEEIMIARGGADDMLV